LRLGYLIDKFWLFWRILVRGQKFERL